MIMDSQSVKSSGERPREMKLHPARSSGSSPAMAARKASRKASPALNPDRSISGLAVARAAAPALLAATLVLAAFHDKAFTIDDSFFLAEAQHVLEDALHPTAFNIVWAQVPERVSQIMASGPVMPYLLVPTVLLDGAEWMAHLTQFLVLALAIIATVALALRVGLTPRGARLAALFLVATPAALAMASTSMPDIAAMAFGVAGMERLYAWKQGGRWHQAFAASLLLGLACLARSHLMVLLGIGALALLDGHEIFRWQRWWAVPLSRWIPLVGALALLALGAWLTQDPLKAGGTSIVGGIRGLMSFKNMGYRLLAFGGYWALASSLVIPWALLRFRQLPWWILIPAGALAWWILHSAPPHWMIPVFGLATVVFWDLVRLIWRRKDHLQLVLTAWLFLALPVVLYVQIAAKYIVASAPAAALILARAVDQRAGRFAHLVAGIAVSAGLALGILIISADAVFAGLGRRAADELIAPQVALGKSVWYTGHWGFHWYAEKAGARPLTRTPPYPQPGDIVVSSTATHSGHLVNILPRRQLIGSLSDASPGGRIMSSGAGFYSHYYGYLPWSWGQNELEHFKVWLIY